MGARLLRNIIEQPLITVEDIRKRQQAVKELIDNYITREEIREYLNPVYDLERIIGRISTKSAGPRELIAFRGSLEMLPSIKKELASLKSEKMQELYKELDTLDDIYDLINRSIVDEPPLQIKDGGIIKDGFNEEVDRLRSAKTDGKNWLAQLEASERERTGIKTLRIKYNKVFGYYLKLQILSKIWFRMIIYASRHLPMQSAIQCQNLKNLKI